MEKYIIVQNNNIKGILDSKDQKLNDVLKEYESCIKNEEVKIYEEGKLFENLNETEKSKYLNGTLDNNVIIQALVRRCEDSCSVNQEQYFYYDEDFYDYD